jgi:outer membrane protein OmpA-like peptidoglycan-associated protein
LRGRWRRFKRNEPRRREFPTNRRFARALNLRHYGGNSSAFACTKKEEPAMIRNTVLAAVLSAVLVSAAAQSTVHFGANDAIDPNEVARILGGEQPRIRTRSLKLLDQPQAEQVEVKASALSLPVQFAFDSAEILPAARAQLDAVAAGIKLLPPTRTVVIEGHTDAIGPEDYNLNLSQRRAAAVRMYLVRVHGIDARRLKHIGFGEYKPIEGLDPAAAENRRVQFRGE